MAPKIAQFCDDPPPPKKKKVSTKSSYIEGRPNALLSRGFVVFFIDLNNIVNVKIIGLSFKGLCKCLALSVLFDVLLLLGLHHS